MILTKADKRSIKYFLHRLNGFLEVDEFRIGQFGRTLKRFEKRFTFKIGIIDFKYYDEHRLMKVRKKMLQQEKIQNFGYMRNLARLERICLNYIELRELFNIKKSKANNKIGDLESEIDMKSKMSCLLLDDVLWKQLGYFTAILLMSFTFFTPSILFRSFFLTFLLSISSVGINTSPFIIRI